jgi:hypothetical protein
MTETSNQLSTTSMPYAQRARNCVISLYVLSLLWGALQIAIPDSPRVYLLFVVLFAVNATFWARFDALARSKPILPILQMLYFFLWPIGATVYLVARSGWRGLGIGLMHAIGLLVTMGLSFYATLYGLHFTGLLDQRFYQFPQ